MTGPYQCSRCCHSSSLVGEKKIQYHSYILEPLLVSVETCITVMVKCIPVYVHVHVYIYIYMNNVHVHVYTRQQTKATQDDTTQQHPSNSFFKEKWDRLEPTTLCRGSNYQYKAKARRLTFHCVYIQQLKYTVHVHVRVYTDLPVLLHALPYSHPAGVTDGGQLNTGEEEAVHWDLHVEGSW